MSVYSSARLWRFPNRQFFNSHSPSQLRYASGSPTDQVELTPSQLIRFTLTGTTSNGNQGIQDLFDRWPLNSPPPSELKLFKPKRQSYRDIPLKRLKRVSTLQQLQTFIEQNATNRNCAMVIQANGCALLQVALRNCEQHHSYGEILLIINGIVARLQRLKAPVSSSIHILGMYYACLSLSTPALYNHLKGYCDLTSDLLSHETSVSLVDTLVYALESIRFGNPGFSTLPMLKLVTGEGGTSTAYRLHDVLFWAHHNHPTNSIEQYVFLLAKLRSNLVLQEVMDISLQDVSPDLQSPVQSKYACVLALANDGNPKEAARYLRQISERLDDTLPGISKFQGLTALLAHEEISKILPELAGDLEYVDIVDSQLGHMERSLGLQWQTVGSVHTSISNSQCVTSGKPLLSIEGDCAGFDSIERLIVGIRRLGCSNSFDDLGMIADLLNEHDGSEISVCLSTLDDGPYNLAWRPQCSPIEFSNAPLPARYDSSKPWSPSTLGLIRGQLDSNGTALENEPSLHLMQLGYLVMQRRSPILPSSMIQFADGPMWQETGHIVAWDRVVGGFLIVFVGKGHGLIDPGLCPSSLQPPPGLSPVTVVSIPKHFYSARTASSIQNGKLHFGVEPDPEL